MRNISTAVVAALMSVNSPIVIDDGAQAIVPGQIYAVNEARFVSSTYSEPLTAYSVGWRDATDLQSMLDLLAPPVPIARRFEFKKAKNQEIFLSDTDDIRAIGSDFKRVEYSGTSVNEKTLNKGLMYRIDKDEDLVSEEQVVSRLQTRLLRNELRRAYTIASAAATNTAKTWSGSATNPDNDVRSAIAAYQLDQGVFPTHAIMALTAWNYRVANLEAQNTAGSNASAARTPTQVAQFLGLKDMKLSTELFQVDASTKQRILTSKVLVFYSEASILKDDPTSLKRFYTPCDGGTIFRVYRIEHAKYVDIIVEHYSNIVAGAGALQQLTIS